MHDFTVVDDGEHALTLMKVPGLSSIAESSAVGYHGECNATWEGFKELKVRDSAVTFEWSAHGHISLDESTRMTASVEEMCENEWDFR